LEVFFLMFVGVIFAILTKFSLGVSLLTKVCDGYIAVMPVVVAL